MKKLFKAAASLTVGCALLSTSAFAALGGSIVETETGATVSLTGYAEKAQSTILVLKGVEELSDDIAESAIAYINQAEATDGTITYDVKVSGDGTYNVFVGGSDQTEAKKLGSFVISSVIPVKGIAITGAEAGAKITVGNTLQLAADVTPDDATDKTVTWTSSSDAIATVDATGLVTAKAAGNVTITAKAGDKTATIALVVEEEAVEPAGSIADVNGDGDITISDAMQIINFVNWEPSILDEMDFDNEALPVADVNSDGDITISDAMQIINYVNWEPSILDDILF